MSGDRGAVPEGVLSSVAGFDEVNAGFYHILEVCVARGDSGINQCNANVSTREFQCLFHSEEGIRGGSLGEPLVDADLAGFFRCLRGSVSCLGL